MLHEFRATVQALHDGGRFCEQVYGILILSVAGADTGLGVSQIDGSGILRMLLLAFCSQLEPQAIRASSSDSLAPAFFACFSSVV